MPMWFLYPNAGTATSTWRFWLSPSAAWCFRPRLIVQPSSRSIWPAVPASTLWRATAFVHILLGPGEPRTARLDHLYVDDLSALCQPSLRPQQRVEVGEQLLRRLGPLEHQYCVTA